MARWDHRAGAAGRATARAQAPRRAWRVLELEECQTGWSIGRSGKAVTGRARGARQGQGVMHGCHFKRGKKPFKDSFFLSRGGTGADCIKKMTVVAAAGQVEVA